MKLTIRHRCPDYATYRAARVKSLFNCESGQSFDLDVDLPVEGQDWQIGLVVGPSGSGKTSIGKALWNGRHLRTRRAWAKDRPIIESITPDAAFDHVTGALSAVGLGSVPSWLRPYHVLSMGEQFRADLARIICEAPRRVVIDEFTSVVDRHIAKIGAMAFTKAFRRTGGQAVLLSCHRDIIEWVQPDWMLDTATGKFSGRCLRPRPGYELEIRQTDWRFWPLFEPHHYLKMPHMIAARNYVGFVEGEPVVHVGIATRPGLVEARACRLVVMPEWQGAGVGMRFLNKLCEMWLRAENPYGMAMTTLLHTSHPGLASALRRDKRWTQLSAGLYGDNGARSQETLKKSLGKSAGGHYGGHFRAVQGFRYYG